MSIVVYLFLLFVGALGFILMTVLGFAHGIGGHHGNAIGQAKVSLPGGHHSGGHTHGAHSPAHSLQSHLPSKGGNVALSAGSDPWRLLMAVSPIDIFSVLLGAGAVGTLLKLLLSGIELAVASGIGGLLFALAIVRPLMGFFLKFASRPSEGLEGEIASVAEAITNFDSQGRGMVKLCLDEQIVQCLAYLEPDEQAQGVKVRRGENVVVISVDPKRNTCMVSRDLAPSTANEASTQISQMNIKTNI